jgi:glycosyltransferase involved in cell wall biosynthesis
MSDVSERHSIVTHTWQKGSIVVASQNSNDLVYAGHVDVFGAIPDVGWFFCGWVEARFTDMVAKAQLSARFDAEELRGGSIVAFYDREGLGDRGVGFITYIKGAMSASSTLSHLAFHHGSLNVAVTPSSSQMPTDSEILLATLMPMLDGSRPVASRYELQSRLTNKMHGSGMSPGAANARIAIISHAHPSVSKGGAEIAAYTLFRGLRQIGVDAIFIAAVSHRDRPRLVFATPHERAVFYDPSRYEWFYNLAPRQIWLDLQQILVAERVQIANFHHFINFGINLLRDMRQETDIAVFLTLHEYLAICHHHGQMVTRPAQNLCYRASPVACATCFPEHSADQFVLRRELFLETLQSLHGLISPSHFLADRFAEWGLQRPITVIENGLAPELQNLRVARPSREEETADRQWVYGFFGQITPFKGMEVLLQAIELIARDRKLARRVRIRIHGGMVGQDPAFVQRFEAVVKSSPFVIALGAYANTDVQRLMAACDYVIIPSTWWENSPVVIQEAYLAGCPVIAADIGGMSEKVPHGVSGLQFRAREAGDLVRLIGLSTTHETYVTLRSGLPQAPTAAGMAERTLRCFSAGLTWALV